jgi:hypothetical protein
MAITQSRIYHFSDLEGSLSCLQDPISANYSDSMDIGHTLTFTAMFHFNII